MNEQTGNIRETSGPLKLNENLIPIGQIVHLPKMGWFRIDDVDADEGEILLKAIPEPEGLKKPYRGPPRNRAERRREANGRKLLRKAKKGKAK